MCLNCYVDKQQLVINTIRESGLTIQEWADKLSVHRNQIHRWLKGDSNIRNSNLYNLGKVIGKKPVFDGDDVSWITIEDENINIAEEKIDMNMTSSKLIELYDENRDLRLKIDELKKSKNPESSHWNDLTYHYTTEVTLHFSGFGVLGRTINKITNIKKQSEILGYSEKEILQMWDIGTKHRDMKDHPINKILHKDTTNELDAIGKTLPTVFNAIKDMIGNHYIPTKIMYKCKDGSYVGAISYNKIDWKNQKVYSKIVFIIEE